MYVHYIYNMYIYREREYIVLCLKGFRIIQRADSQTMFGAYCPLLSTVMMDIVP